MKNKNLILSVLFWAVASVCMAVSLPSSSYTGSFIDNGVSTETLLGTGVRMNSTLLSSSDIDVTVCTTEGVEGDPAYCGTCCQEKILFKYDDEEAYKKCVNSCTNGYSLGESPLGEVLILLPFIAIYAVIRRNRKDKE